MVEPATAALVPHVLKDGADSVGILGALNRVYLDIGLFSEECLQHFNPLDRRQGHHPDRDRGGAQELRDVERQRDPDPGRGPVLRGRREDGDES